MILIIIYDICFRRIQAQTHTRKNTQVRLTVTFYLH